MQLDQELQIDPQGLYKITKLWITKPPVDKSTWTYNTQSKIDVNHGVRMIPKSKYGQCNILMGMDSRVNHGTIRTGEAMIHRRYYY